ncbi:hypothetical protein SAMN05216419_102317 [Nitrosomonas cryotolerans]|nr:hypothetical protein SAMN05216419_102317 [Nitrosomonas cryotolerans]
MATFSIGIWHIGPDRVVVAPVVIDGCGIIIT